MNDGGGGGEEGVGGDDDLGAGEPEQRRTISRALVPLEVATRPRRLVTGGERVFELLGQRAQRQRAAAQAFVDEGQDVASVVI